MSARRRLLGGPCLAALLIALPLHAQTMGGGAGLSPIGDASSTTVTAAGSATSRSLAARFAERLNVKDYGAVMDGSTDDSAALDATIAAANTLMATGARPCVYVPFGNLHVSTGHAIRAFVGPGCVYGEGSMNSIVSLDTTYSGDLFVWSEAWRGVNVGGVSAAGPWVRGLEVLASRSATAQQNAFMFYDRDGFVTMEDVYTESVNGMSLSFGHMKNATQAYTTESTFTNMRFRNGGGFVANTTPVIDFYSDCSSCSGADTNNEDSFINVAIYSPFGPGLLIRNNNPNNLIRYIFLTNLRVEGLQNSQATSDLIDIGDPTGTISGKIATVTMVASHVISPYVGASGLGIYGTLANAPTNISFAGEFIRGAGSGNDVNIAGAGVIQLRATKWTSTGTNLVVASNLTVSGPITVDFGGQESSLTTSIDSTSLSLIRYPTYSPNPLNLTSSPVTVPGQTGAGSAAGADTTEDVVGTVPVAGNSMGLNGCIKVGYVWDFTANTDTKTLRVRFGASGTGGTAYLNRAIASATIATHSGSLTICNRGATNSQVGAPSSGLAGDQAGSPVTSSVDTTTAKNVVFTCQKGTAGDLCELDSFRVEQ